MSGEAVKRLSSRAVAWLYTVLADNDPQELLLYIHLALLKTCWVCLAQPAHYN